LHGDAFGTRITSGNNPYIWLGTDKVFDSFVFAFEKTPGGGWIWFHAYPSSSAVSTCIVECPEETWRSLGMDRRGEADRLGLLAEMFQRPLGGRRLISQARGEPARWLRFKQVTNESLHHGNTVLLGDAGHTTHFTIGSGTRLAMIDAVELARSLGDFPEDVAAALADFDERALPNVQRMQSAARGSMSWYEHADEYLDGRGAVDAAFAMASRGGSPNTARYRKFRREQVPVVRRARAVVEAGNRTLLAAGRGQIPFVPAWHPGPPPRAPAGGRGGQGAAPPADLRGLTGPPDQPWSSTARPSSRRPRPNTNSASRSRSKSMPRSTPAKYGCRPPASSASRAGCCSAIHSSPVSPLAASASASSSRFIAVPRTNVNSVRCVVKAVSGSNPASLSAPSTHSL
jgi:hypothetical protein